MKGGGLMKRVFAILFAAIALLSACGSSETPSPEMETAVTEPAPAPEPTPEPEPEPEPTAEELAAAELEALLSSMTLEEKVGQLFFARCPAENALEDISAYHLGGYLLFGRDYQDSAGNWLTEEQFVQTIAGYQEAADAGIPLLIGSDEEGGTVTRASRNPNLFHSKFLSPQALLKTQSDHGSVFAEDAWEKNSALLRLGINVNLSPVCDVSTDPGDFIYDRALGLDAAATAQYTASVVGAMKDCGIGSVLKHFPGYGSNVDTHTGIAIDSRDMEAFTSSDFLPFLSGIAAGGNTTAVLVSHNIVECMDPRLPASLSPAVHDILRTRLGFDGVVMTDDLAMDAVAAYAEDGAVAVMAIQAGNDLVITSDHRTQIPKVLEAVENGTLGMETIDAACLRVLRWKQALGLL